MFFTPVVGGILFTPFSTVYTSVGAQTIAIPSGATLVRIRLIAAGATGGDGGGGGGGEFAETTALSVVGLSAIYLFIPASAADAYAKENTSGGADITRAKYHVGAEAQAGGTGGTGDILHKGGDGYHDGSYSGNGGGGGGGGPTSAGSNASGNTGGAGGGSPAGAGGNKGNAGQNYGGGGGGGGTSGTQGWGELAWN